MGSNRPVLELRVRSARRRIAREEGLPFTRLSHANASMEIAVSLVLMWRGGPPTVVLLRALGMILAVPAKMLLDRQRRARLSQPGQSQPLP